MQLTNARLRESIASMSEMPTAVTYLGSIASDPHSTATDFERAVLLDAGLTANILRIANSAAFGLSRQVSSVSHAVALIGQKRLYEIAIAGGFTKTIPKTLPGYNCTGPVFWLHNAASAVLSESISAALGLACAGRAMVPALLHDCGKIVISNFLKNHLERVAECVSSGEATLLEMENSLLGTDHTLAGELLAKTWKLPEIVATVARYHHDPMSCPNEEDRVIAAVVHVASNLAHGVGLGHDVGELNRSIDEEAANWLGVDDMVAQRAVCDSLDRINELQEMFESAGA